MKKLLLTGALILSSLSGFANDNDRQYDYDCAQRYIQGSVDLVEIAKAYNNAEIDNVTYSFEVMAVVAQINAMRLICIDENREAQECVDSTKSTYKNIRSKMYVREVLKDNINKISVSDLDLLPLSKGAVKGFINKLKREKTSNLCTLVR